jgi:hypothetical protein
MCESRGTDDNDVLIRGMDAYSLGSSSEGRSTLALNVGPARTRRFRYIEFASGKGKQSCYSNFFSIEESQKCFRRNLKQ